MQNITVLSTPPATPAQSSTAADIGSEQLAESFDSVLARQLADQSQSAEENAPGTDLPKIISVNDELIIEASSDRTDYVQAPASDNASALPGDMLAALLPQNIPAQIRTNSGQSATPETTLDQAHPAAMGKKIPIADTLRSPEGASSASRSQGSANMNSAFATALEVLKSHSATKMISAAQTSAPTLGPTVQTALQTQVISTTLPGTPIQVAINTHMSQNTWADEFSQKITWLSSQHNQSAELHLNPPQLGPLDVVIRVSGDQATALFTSPHAAVRDLIEQALPKLREMMADNGIMLGNATVSDQSPREQQARQSEKQPENGQLIKESGSLSASGVKAGDMKTSGQQHNGMVDVFA